MTQKCWAPRDSPIHRSPEDSRLRSEPAKVGFPKKKSSHVVMSSLIQCEVSYNLLHKSLGKFSFGGMYFFQIWVSQKKCWVFEL